MADKSQLMRGTLEGCILKIISLEQTYGYEIVEHLQQHGFADVKEGSIYPLLIRLERKGIVASEYRPSPLGPTRKYYTLTENGQRELEDFCQIWQEVSKNVETILNRKEGF